MINTGPSINLNFSEIQLCYIKINIFNPCRRKVWFVCFWLYKLALNLSWDCPSRVKYGLFLKATLKESAVSTINILQSSFNSRFTATAGRSKCCSSETFWGWLIGLRKLEKFIQFFPRTVDWWGSRTSPLWMRCLYSLYTQLFCSYCFKTKIIKHFWDIFKKTWFIRV